MLHIQTDNLAIEAQQLRTFRLKKRQKPDCDRRQLSTTDILLAGRSLYKVSTPRYLHARSFSASV